MQAERAKKVVNRTYLVSVVGITIGLIAYGVTRAPAEPDQDMNDRIIAQTAKCVAAGMEAEVERSFAPFGWHDEFFVVCKTPEINNLDRLTRQMEQETQRKEIQRRVIENPNGFEAKSKRTE